MFFGTPELAYEKEVEYYGPVYFVQPGAVLSQRELVLGMVRDAGFDPKIAEVVIECESGFDPERHNWNDPNGGSHGLWQLNGIHDVPMIEMLNPIKATEHAINLLNSERSWRHWSCYTKHF